MSAAHTPTPWTTDDFSVRGAVTQSGVSPWLFDVYGSDGDAAFIVKAVNAHDELIAALLPFANAVDDGGNLKGGVLSSSYRADFIRARAVVSRIEAAFADLEAMAKRVHGECQIARETLAMGAQS